jgi:hypothetical protein
MIETVALATPNNVADFVSDAPAERTPMMYSPSEWTNLPFSDSFKWAVTQHKSLMHSHLPRKCKEMAEDFSV